MEKRLIRVFVSATSDLEPEREVIGEALARFPVPLGWEIKRTALPGEQVPAAVDEVRRSDFFLFMLGADITAPTGAELEAAVEAGIPMLPLVKRVTHTLAARFFWHGAALAWAQFETAEELRRLVVDFLARALVENPVRYGLSADEYGALSQYLQGCEERQEVQPGVAGKGKEPAGAERGAVIIGGAAAKRG